MTIKGLRGMPVASKDNTCDDKQPTISCAQRLSYWYFDYYRRRPISVMRLLVEQMQVVRYKTCLIFLA